MESRQELERLRDTLLCCPVRSRDKLLALEFLEGDWEGRNSIPLSPFSTAARILKEPDRVI